MNKLFETPLHTGVTIGLFASSKQGKTELLKYLWRNYFRKTHITVVCSPTIHSPTYDEMRIECICTEHLVTFKYLLEEVHYIQSHTRAKVPILFILDDCVTSREDPRLKEMFLTLRNLNISTILSLQGCSLMNKHNRSSMNYGFFGRFLGEEGMLPIINTFLEGAFPDGATKKEKVKMYRDVTSDYHFLFRDMLDGDQTVRVRIKLPG